jgi:cation diffusion facilitator family transporter
MSNNKQIDLKKGEKAAKYSTYANLALALMKLVVGLLSGSIALLADAIHSFSDIFASVAVYIGLKLSQKGPDEKFQYGYYKFETLSSLIISIIIIVTGFEIAVESVNGIISPQQMTIPFLVIAVSLISILVSYLLSRYKEKVGREINSPALINDGKHSFVDVFSSLIVFLGILFSYIGYPIFQGFAGFLVALLIIYIGFKYGKQAVLILLDANLDPKTVQTIKSIALNQEGILGVHDIKIRSSGPYVFAELHIETEKRLTIEKADLISKKLEKLIRKELKDLDSLLIKVDPSKKTTVKIAVPIDKVNGLNSRISKHFGKAPYYLIADVDKDNIRSYVLKGNPADTNEQKKGIKAAQFLINENIDILLFNGNINEGPSYALQAEMISVIKPDVENLGDSLLNAAHNDLNT